jgi:hypothetical protein
MWRIVTIVVVQAVLVFVWLWYTLYLERKIVDLKKVRRLETSMPDGTRFYYDAYTERKCKRCSKGRIALRKRFMVSHKDKGSVALKALADVHWCDNCSYRNTSLISED